MGRTYSQHKFSFASGEVSPKVVSRTDLDDVQKGVAEMTNFLAQPQGGAIKRSGTRWLRDLSASSQNLHKLIPFVFNSEDSYIIILSQVLSEIYVGVYDNSGREIVRSNDESVLNISFSGVDFDINNVWYFQSGNTLFLCSNNFSTKLIVRNDETGVWSFRDLELSEPPYDEIIDEPTQFEAFQDNNNNYLRFPISAIPTKYRNIFTDSSGRAQTEFFIRIRVDSDGDDRALWIGYKILTDSVPSGLQMPNQFTARVDLTTFTTFDAITKTWRNFNTQVESFRFGLLFDDPSQYPAFGGFHKGRLWLGGTTANPRSLYASQPQDFFNFAPTNLQGEVLDDSGLNFTIDHNEAFEMDWMLVDRDLNIGSSTAIFLGRPAARDSAITPTDFNVFSANRDGSSRVRPVSVDDSVIYVDRTGRKVRSFVYDFASDSFPANDLTLLADHLFEHPVKELHLARLPEKYIFALDTAGNVFALSYERANNIVGWSRLDFNSEVISMIVIPDSQGRQDRLYFIIDRTDFQVNIDSLECMEALFDKSHGSSLGDAWFVDSGEEVASTATIPARMRGGDISATWNGEALPFKSGMDSSSTASVADTWELPDGFGNDDRVAVGFNYQARLEMLPLEFRTADGTSVGKIHDADEITMQLRDASNFEFYSRRPTADDTDDDIDKIKVDVIFSKMPDDDFFIGEQLIRKPRQIPEREVQFYIESNIPSPLNILSMAIYFDIEVI